jgi:uncharacterized protein (UPF0332 family)
VNDAQLPDDPITAPSPLFSLHFIKTGIIPKEIGVIFSILQKIREDSDYEIGTFYGRGEAERLLVETRLFCSTVIDVLKASGKGDF